MEKQNNTTQIVETQHNTAAVYGRVSSEEQAGNASTRGQIAEAERFCAFRGYEIVGTYFDEAKSGKSIAGRDQLELLLADARAKKFEHVIVWKLSRLSRNLLETLTIIQDLAKFGIHFHSVTETDFDTTSSMGKALLGILAVIAEFERNVIAENVKMGMRQRKSEGAWVATVMIGYRLPPRDKKAPRTADTGKLVVEPAEAETVRLIFSAFASGQGLKAIANRLNREGRLTKRGNSFAPPQVAAILDNDVYLGRVHFTTVDPFTKERRDFIVENAHEAIIDTELWDKVCVLREVKKGKNTRSHEQGFVLTGLLLCPQCGSPMTMSRSTAVRKDGTRRITERYACSKWKNKGSSECHSNGIVAEQAERAVFARLRKLITSPTLLKAVVRRVNERQETELRPVQRRLAVVDKEKPRLKRALDRYFDDYEREIMDSETLTLRTASIKEQLAKLESEGAELQAKLRTLEATGHVPFEVVKVILEDFASQLQQADVSQQKALLELLVKEIRFERGKGITSIRLHLNDDVARALGLPTPTGLPGSTTLTA